MKCIKRKVKKEKVWKGTCCSCGSEFEATSDELHVIGSQRDGAFAWHDCSECNAKDCDAICFYPKEN